MDVVARKVILAAAGPPRRTLPTALPEGFRLPDGFSEPRVCMPGVLAVQGPRFGKLAGRGQVEVLPAGQALGPYPPGRQRHPRQQQG